MDNFSQKQKEGKYQKTLDENKSNFHVEILYQMKMWNGTYYSLWCVGMSRPYPRQLAGTNVKFSFDVEKKTFDLKFEAFKGENI